MTASTRTAGPRANLADLNVARVDGDDTLAGHLENWVPGHRLVVDAAAPYALDLHDPQRSHADRLADAEDRMTRLLGAAAQSGATLVHVGSILTQEEKRSASLRRRIVEAAHPYFRLKRRLEKLAIDAALKGQAVAVVNPASLLGPWNLRPFHHCYVSAVLTGGMPASFAETINVLDVRDAAETILRVTEAGWFGRPVPVAGRNITVHDLTDMIVELGDARRPPRWPALAAGAAVIYAAETAMGSVGIRSPYPSLPVLLTLVSGPVHPGQVHKALGPVLRPLRETVADEIAWHRARGCP